MKLLIDVPVEAGSKGCGECRFQVELDVDLYYCEAFGDGQTRLTVPPGESLPRRCAPCLTAEAEASKLSRVAEAVERWHQTGYPKGSSTAAMCRIDAILAEPGKETTC